MKRDPKVYLWDAKRAIDSIKQFTSGKNLADYVADQMLRSAVERQFEIMGEALSQLAKTAPDVGAQIPDLPRIVAFRNILIHGYAVVDNEIVWRAIQENLPDLLTVLQNLLAEPE